MSSAKQLSACAPPAAVAAAGLALSLPVWLYGWPGAGDALFHASWFAHFDAQLRAGELYPRWLAGMNGGLGSPAFYYYPPVPYYCASFVKLLVPAGEHGLRALGAAAAVAFTASGLAAYAWLKRLARPRSAAAAAILYLLLPYHSAVDLYTREAFAELWAFVWMPLALRFARALAADSTTPPAPTPDAAPPSDERRAAHAGSDSALSRDLNHEASPRDPSHEPPPRRSNRVRSFLDSRLVKPLLNSTVLGLLHNSSFFNSLRGSSFVRGSNFRLNFAGLAVTYALLAASHPPATLIFTPLLAAYVLLSARRRRTRAALTAAAALLLGAGLAAVYLLPALALQDAASFDAMLAFNYFERWLTFARADARDLYGLLLWGTLTTLALTACAALLRDSTPPPDDRANDDPTDTRNDDETPTTRHDDDQINTRRDSNELMAVPPSTSNLDELTAGLSSTSDVPDELSAGDSPTNAADELQAGPSSTSSGRARPTPTATDASRRRETVFWLVAAALSALLMTHASDPLWRALPALQRVQFPWRFNLLLALAAAAAAALGLDTLRGRNARANLRLLLFAGLVCAAWLVLLGSAARRAYPAHDGRPSSVLADARAAFAHGRDAPEYRPRWSNLADEDAIRHALLRACGETLRDVRACLEREGDVGSAILQRRGPRALEIFTDSDTGLELRVTQLYFPGWSARLDGRTHPLRASSPDGLLALSVPPGPHHLRLTLEPTRPERAGLLITTASSLALLLLVTPRPQRPRRTSP